MKRKKAKSTKSTPLDINSIGEQPEELAPQPAHFKASQTNIGTDLLQNISKKEGTSNTTFQESPRITPAPTLSTNTQSKTTMLFASFFLGAIGLHRLLMGYKNWWIMLLTLGGFGIWSLFDFTRIALGKMPMANGQPLEK